MRAALYDPSGGYYQRSDRARWGREGDYRTSPERSELFAATLAHYFAKLSEELNGLTIVECGAGDGSFAFGVLSTLREQLPSLLADTRYIVYDVSADALGRTRERVHEFGDRVEFYSDWDRVAVDGGIFFANELLDAFPIHRVLKKDGELAEFYVDVDDSGNFRWTTGPLSSEFITDELAEGQVVEINPGIDDWLAQVATKLDHGFVITVDYGAEAADLYQRPEGTLRAFSKHGFVDDLLVQPGDYDLTTTINWSQVRTAGAKLGFEVVEFSSQDRFLLQAGLLDQLEYRLSRTQTDAERTALTLGAREMILPGGMASSFQVLVQKRSR